MIGIKTSTRLALSIGIVGAAILWFAADFGIVPNPVEATLDGRIGLAKAIAVDASTAVEQNHLLNFETVVGRIVASNDDLVSVGIERGSGFYSVASENHEFNWNSNNFPNSCRVSTDVFQGGQLWGKLQILFNPNNELLANSWLYPLGGVFFLFAALTIATWLMLNQTFRYLSPSKVVPDRVRTALDSLTEGLVLLDPNGEIVHANIEFLNMIGGEDDELIGTKLDVYDWIVLNGDLSGFPWDKCLETKEGIRGRILELNHNETSKKYIVNSSPVFGSSDKVKGALISFDDVTALESKKNELAEIILTLRKSKDEVSRQNEELYFLANCDPLTKCFNRRSFWNQYNEMWNECETGQLNLMMVDIDHFKSINDNYGHGVGDEVLRETGELLRQAVLDRGTVCRYGGEEFVILVPSMEFEQALKIANEVHSAFQKKQLGGLDVKVSIGVSNTGLGVMDMQHLLDQADQCLYAAKRNGRNQVVRYDQCDHEMSDTESQVASPSLNINYSTVTGLLSALALKCPKTAEHSVRVADLCVAIGQRLVSKRNLYRLEVCGLLHDIGKIGVPDQILNKPGPLSDSEWQVMNRHDEYGVSIIRSAFESDEIADIIRQHKESFGNHSSSDYGLLQENTCPMESRIISACDAFDSMIGDKVYRPAQPLDVAIIELKRCTPDQFDPIVVEHLINYVSQPGFMKTRNVSVHTSSKAAVSIAKHLENFHSAVANESIRELQNAVDMLKDETVSGEIVEIADATDRLEAAMSTDDCQLSQIMEIAEEVMQLCRATRTSIVSPVSIESDV